MKFNPITLILTLAFLYPLLRGFILKFSSNNVKRDINSVGSDLSFIAALFLGIYFSRKIFLQHDEGIYKKLFDMIPVNFTDYIQNNPLILYIIIIPICIYIIYKLINLVVYGISLITLFPLVDVIEGALRSKGDGFKRTLGVVFQIPRAICYVLTLAFLINIFSVYNKNAQLNQYMQDSKLYNNICKEIVIPVTKSSIAKQLPSIINNSFKIQVKDLQPTKSVVYYNGVTLDEGIQSDNQIDSFARNLCAGQKSVKSKAKILYTWVGRNISYDEAKANAILNNDTSEKSGAIPAFDTRKGICFDYACLYVAMCRANGIKVRLITGEGFNGVSWVGHAWNQVYLPNEGRWINVDPTFYRGGNYFDNPRFYLDHKPENTAGEW